MNAPLIFEALCNRHVIGVVIVQDGAASARVGQMSLNGTLLGHALMWVREHNPDPFADVEFRLALGNAGTGVLPGNRPATTTPRVNEVR